MMLISEMVRMKWRKNNKEWYESKGYVFTKIGDEFEVRSNDLTNCSRMDVKTECDGCNIVKTMPFYNYKNIVKEDGKCYCKKCSTNLFGKEKLIKTKLANGKSLEQWCIENDRYDIVDRWDYELNNCKPNEITHATKTKYYFKCICGLHKSELKSVHHFTSGQTGSLNCIACGSIAQDLINKYGANALEKYWDYEKNTVDPWELARGSNIKKIWIKCTNVEYHDSYETTANAVSTGSECPYCSIRNGKVHYKDSLGCLYPQILEMWSDKNNKTPYEYKPWSMAEVWWKCPEGKHDDYKRSVNSSNRLDFHCPKCTLERNESYLQEKVRLYLESLNNGEYTILHENKCTIVPKTPKIKNTNNTLPFDNEIKELKLIIEVMGCQHYSVTGFHKKHAKRNGSSPEYELHKQKLYDRYKRIYAKSQGYFYLEIPYWKDNKKETWKELIDNKINEILIKGEVDEK